MECFDPPQKIKMGDSNGPKLKNKLAAAMRWAPRLPPWVWVRRERDGRVYIRLHVVANAACEPAAAILPETTRHMTLLVT